MGGSGEAEVETKDKTCAILIEIQRGRKRGTERERKSEKKGEKELGLVLAYQRRQQMYLIMERRNRGEEEN